MQHRNRQYALYAAACRRGGLEPNVDSDAGWWGAPLWIYTTYALIIYGRAAAERTGHTLKALAQELARQHDVMDSWPAASARDVPRAAVLHRSSRRYARRVDHGEADAAYRLRESQERLHRMFDDGSSDEIHRAFDDVHDAERALAAARGEQYARPLDLGARWSGGAPLPHLLTNGSRAWIVCHAAEDNPAWDGTTVQVVSASDTAPSRLMVIGLERCQDIRIGGPNDEAREGHPLSGRGLVEYSAHEVVDSLWREEARSRNSVHPQHTDDAFAGLRHYVLLFHDEMVEALARGISASIEEGTLDSVLTSLSARLAAD